MFLLGQVIGGSPRKLRLVEVGLCTTNKWEHFLSGPVDQSC
jgi:hypothetical protein